MRLAGQDRKRERGYALAVLLVAIAVMSILLTEAMPVWHQEMQREKEAELIFRGEQYAHAIILFQHKYGPVLPPNIDLLVTQKFLRRKYKDPMTGGDFQPIYQTTARPGQPGTTVPGIVPGETTGPATPPAAGMATGSLQPGSTAGGHGGLIGVVSRSAAKSIRIYNGYDHYNKWAFVYTQFMPKGAATRPGQAGQGTTKPGQPVPPRPAIPQFPRPQVPGSGGDR